MALEDFVGLTSAQLTELQTAYAACLVAIATAGQSYQISGRQFTRADLPEVRATLGAVNYALAQLNQTSGTARTRTVAGFGSPYSQ